MPTARVLNSKMALSTTVILPASRYSVNIMVDRTFTLIMRLTSTVYYRYASRWTVLHSASHRMEWEALPEKRPLGDNPGALT